jgi:hypothetical protein
MSSLTATTVVWRRDSYRPPGGAREESRAGGREHGGVDGGADTCGDMIGVIAWFQWTFVACDGICGAG